MSKRVAVIGGGAAGFFAAINMKEMCGDLEVHIFERSHRVLSKVEVSGGGRCNCTNTFEGVSDLVQVYPRGHRLMKRLMNVFDHRDAYQWFERHGVPLVVQPDHCVFPAAQDSHAIIDCFLQTSQRLGVVLHLSHPIRDLDDLSGYDRVLVATGGSPRAAGLQWLAALGHETASPLPSLFSFSISDKHLTSLMGTVAEHTIVQLPGTKLHAEGALLVTHWGLSGPAILRLSSYGARHLYDVGYRAKVIINWSGKNEHEVREWISLMMSENGHKQLSSITPPGMSHRLWNYLLEKTKPEHPSQRWESLGKKDVNRLVNALMNDEVEMTGRSPFRDEFVTCGGISLSSVRPTTMESKVRPGLFFAGEILDIDGVTGGFNFQAAWTTAYVASKSIVDSFQALASVDSTKEA